MNKSDKAKAMKMARKLEPMVNAYLLAKCHAEIEREKMDAIDAEILDYLDVRYGDNHRERAGGRITDPKHSWLMADEYAGDYYAERDRRIREAGYSVEPGYCPALIAENLVRQTVRLLIDSAAEFVPGLTWDNCAGHHKAADRAVELLVGLVVNAPGYTPPKIKGAE